MSATTKIEYLDRTWNPIAMRCTRVSPGCDHCWHLRMADRHAANPSIRVEVREARGGGKPWLNETELLAPLRWKTSQMIGVMFMGDLLAVPFEMVDRVFAIMALCPQHTFIVLTKRPERMREYLTLPAPVRYAAQGPYLESVANEPRRVIIQHRCHGLLRKNPDAYIVGEEVGSGRRWPLPNIWFGVTAENQEQADLRIPTLLQIPAAKRLVSIEPMLGPVDLTAVQFPQPNGGRENVLRCDVSETARKAGIDKLNGIDWVICGGESGPGARPMHPDWVRSLRDQCAAAEVPFFFKQWGEWAPNCLCSSRLPHRSCPRPQPGKVGVMFRCGKRAAGHQLDGLEHLEVPQ